MTRPLDPYPSEAARARGWRGELRLRRALDRARAAGELDFLQPDAIVLPPDGRAYMIEAKAQEYFRAPPFDGQGIALWQLEKIERARAATGLRTLFVVFDDGVVYAAWLDELEAGDHFDTAGTIKSPCRIYPLSSYRRLG
jgi:hypothetical protein